MAIITGSTNNDLLVGTTAGDEINGLTGNDQLDGSTGDDTYVFAAGDGFDVIFEGTVLGTIGPEAGGTDTVALIDGYDPATTQLQRWGNDLVIQNFQTGDQIVVSQHFGSYLDGNIRSAIERITFADGTIWNSEAIGNRIAQFNSNFPTESADTIGGALLSDYIFALGGNDTVSGGQGDDQLYGNAGDDHLFGGDGNDVLIGEIGNDVLAGGKGNDILDGGSGNDTYLFNSGDGVDRIYDMPMAAPMQTNRVLFGEGIRFQDLLTGPGYVYDELVINVGTNGDQLILGGSPPDPNSAHAISSFGFFDGTVATYDAVLGYGSYQQGTEFNDILYGSWYADSLYGNGGDDQLYADSGNDNLAGGQGNDYLSGGQGDDTYYFNRGDGMDFIDDYAMSPFEGNRVVFGAGISVDDVRMRSYSPYSSTSLLEIASSESGSPAAGPIDALRFSNFYPSDAQAPRSVSLFEFADGTVLSADDLIARGFFVGGSEWNDYLVGTDLNERIYGYGGDDGLLGQGGNDTLIGGTGNDQLDGGVGNDSYLFALGDGFDFVWEGSGLSGTAVGGNDTVTLTGYDPATTQLQRGGNDLVIQNLQTGDQVIVREHFGSYMDGSTRSAIERISFADGTIWNATAINARLASMNNNMPTEGNDTIGGYFGSDYIYAMGGNDTVSGGQGDDQLIGGLGNDSLFGGDGNDLLVGDEGSDTLGGGTGNDVLNGWLGNDTYLFNRGDGIDRIEDMSPIPGERNHVVFGSGIRFADLRAQFDSYVPGVIIDVGQQGDALRLIGATMDTYGPRVIDDFKFSDGTVATYDAVIGIGTYQLGMAFTDWMYGSQSADSLYGNGGDDYLFGDNGNDILAGGQGVDYLSGGKGNDTYVFNLGDGSDFIDEFLPSPTNDNRVQFGEGISVADVRLRSDGITGYLEIGNSGDALHFSEFFPWMSGAPQSVSSFEFADGSTFTTNDFIAAINEAPVTSGQIPDQVIQEDSSFDFTLPFGSFVDPNGGPLNYYATLVDGNPLPSWLVFDGGSQRFYGFPENADVDSVAIRITAVDSIGATAFADFGLTVTNVNDTPVATGTVPSQATNEDSAFFYTVPADTFSDVDVGDTLTWSATLANGSPLPAWLTFDSNSRTFSGTPTNSDVASLALLLTVTDMAGAAATQAFTLTVNNTNDAPIVANLIPNPIAFEDNAFSFTVPADSFVDVDANDTLTFSATGPGGVPLPSWLSFDSATRTFSGTPTNDDVGGVLGIVVTVTDSAGTSATSTFDLTVLNTNDVPILAKAIADQTTNEDATFSFSVPANTFSDVDIGDSLIYSATLADGSGLPAWLSFDAVTRTFFGTPVNADVGNVNVLVTVIDTGGATASELFRLTIANTNDAPVVALGIADQAGAEGSAFSYVVPATTFSDVDMGDSLVYTATLANGSSLPTWLSFSSTTRTLSGNPADGNAGSYTVRVTATDGAGASAFDDFVLTVADSLVTIRNGTSSSEILQGTAFRDTLNGLGGNDTMYGYAGNDTLDGGSGSDRMYGGTGDDIYVVNTSSDVVTELANEGSDTVNSSTSYTLGSNIENLSLTGSSSINATGNTLDNVIIGNSANNTLTGNAGNDWLDGGAGSDTLRGGTGNDTYVVSTSGDVVTENSNEGTDTVRTSISYTLGNNVENLTLTGAGTASGTGNSLNNVITGNSASNTLTGNAGHDTFQGLGGNDTLRGGTGNDIYLFGRGDGADTISENDSTTGNRDTANIGVNALDMVFSRSGNNLLLNLHGSTDTLTVQNWYTGTQYQTEVIQAQDGSTLANTQVANLIQAMATFSANNGGITWDQAIDQNAGEVQGVLAAYWQGASG